jgi:hypothetical protein
MAEYEYEYEFFALTGLLFDPLKKNPSVVHNAIEEKRKKFNDELAPGGGSQVERDALNKRLSDLIHYESEIFTQDNKLTDKYFELAQNRIDKEIEGLKATVAMMKKFGTHVITDGTIIAQKKLTQLSKERVKGVFDSAGIKIESIKKLKELLKFPTNVDQLYKNIQALRKEKPSNGADYSGITDLYSFAAFMCDEKDNTSLYRNKATAELKVLFDQLAIKFAGSGEKYFHFCADIVSAGQMFVFNSEENRKAYNDFLLYNTPELKELFELLKKVPPQIKLDSKYAENCIKSISEVFGNRDISLAIYNKEAGIEDEPYIPEKIVFHVKCAHCQYLNEFDSVSEAQAENKCKADGCGKPLYKLCNKCQNKVLASLDKCPECGFIFAGAAMFAKLIAAAEQALRRSDFEEARNCLLQAQAADPSESAKTSQLEARITAEEQKYEKPLNDLRKLIADRKYQRASETLAGVIGSFPGLNVAVFDSQIKAALTGAKTAFANTKNMSPSKKAAACLEILHECADFNPAIDFLRSAPPEACKSFAVVLDSAAYSANLSWSRSTEQGITYRVVRKQGKDTPANEKDGEILLDNTTETSFSDNSIQPGRYYGYAVFAARYGVFSYAVGKTVALSADVTDAHCEQLDKNIRITWNNPPNCTGITIKRTSEGITTTLTNNANGSFEDKGVKYGIAYSYNLQANYNGLPPSGGVDLIITPMLKIESFTFRAEQSKGNTYKITWDIKYDGIDLRILVDEKQVRELKSDMKSCDVSLPPDGFHKISVMAYSGGSWLRSSNSTVVNTYIPCSIDKQTSQLREDRMASERTVELHLKIDGSIPVTVTGFYCAVRTKLTPDAKAPWADRQEIGKAADIFRVSLSAYQKSDAIVHIEKAHKEDAYYVSLFTIYNFNEKEIISNAARCRFDRPLIGDIYWEVSTHLLGGAELAINIYANREIERIPELVLCACLDGQHLLSHTDPKGFQLMSIPELRLEKPEKYGWKNTYDIAEKRLKGLKLFLFEASAVPNENFTLRYTGFKRKV